MTHYDLVIPTIGRESLQRLLDALSCSRGPKPHNIVLVNDRRDPERSLRLPSSLSEQHLVCIVATGGRDPAAARNAGARVGTAEWLVFLDDDVVPDPDWCERLAHDLQTLPRQVAVSRGWISVPELPGRKSVDFEHRSFATSDLAMRRAHFVALGGFDLRFRRPHREDTELLLRAQAAGLGVTRGTRSATHVARPDRFLDSVRAQAGNADDVLLAALYGSRWRRRAGEGHGRLHRHALDRCGGDHGVLCCGARRTPAGAGGPRGVGSAVRWSSSPRGGGRGNSRCTKSRGSPAPAC